ncbi:MAG: NAD(P)-dependent oxidoreductase, partial [bacterium]
MDLNGKRVTVIGYGKTGEACVRVLLKLGARVKLSDKKKDLAVPNGVDVELGRHTEEFILDSDLIVLSPGVRWDEPILKKAREKGIEVIS